MNITVEYSAEQKLEQIYQYLLEEIESKTAEDNCTELDIELDPMDYSGGNYDDCYGLVTTQGYKIQAETILYKFFNDIAEDTGKWSL